MGAKGTVGAVAAVTSQGHNRTQKPPGPERVRERQLLSQVADSSPLWGQQALGKTPYPPSNQDSGAAPAAPQPSGPNPPARPCPAPPCPKSPEAHRAEASRQTQAQGPWPGDCPGGSVASNMEVKLGPYPVGPRNPHWVPWGPHPRSGPACRMRPTPGGQKRDRPCVMTLTPTPAQQSGAGMGRGGSSPPPLLSLWFN